MTAPRRGKIVLVTPMKIPLGSIRPEMELLLLCACRSRGPDDVRRLGTLAGGCHDGDRLIDLTSRHGALPVLYVGLRDGAAAIAPAILARLKACYVSIAAGNTRKLEEVLRLNGLFARHGITALPFKGPVLAIQAYGNCALRDFVDLDFLVSRDELLKAGEVLKADGYLPALRLTAGQARAYLRSGQDWVFSHPGRKAYVDLNSVIASHTVSRPQDVDAMLARARTIAVEGRPVRVAPPEDTLIALCIHGGRHAWDQLSRVMDVAAVIETNADLDWGRLIRDVDRRRVRRTVLVGLALAADLLGAKLPDLAQGMMAADNRVRSQTAAARRRLAEEAPGPRSQIATWSFCLRACECLRDKARFLFRELCVPSTLDWQCVRLPGWLYPLFYFIRPCRLLAEWLRHPRKGAATAG